MSESTNRIEKRPRIKSKPKHQSVFSTDRAVEKVREFIAVNVLKTGTALS